MTQKTAEQMAAELLEHVKRTHASELVLLEARIAGARRYMQGVISPSTITLAHVASYLNGDQDHTFDLPEVEFVQPTSEDDKLHPCGCGGLGTHGVDHTE